MDYVIKLADFTKTPMGRFISDSKSNSGEAFREEVIIPALNANNSIIINLDDVKFAIGSSFLEESIGGLIRLKGFTEEDIRKRIKIESSNEIYKLLIDKYIKIAEGIRVNKKGSE
ncbi:STAS-like domain-containing protein [Proteus faecis]|uniref:STAS-like domain-containing protein n=1 Tax=Proteus faecis TaxID=2050967 RepID=UPI00301DDA57